MVEAAADAVAEYEEIVARYRSRPGAGEECWAGPGALGMPVTHRDLAVASAALVPRQVNHRGTLARDDLTAEGEPVVHPRAGQDGWL